jgi:hypothetical protein
MRTTERTIIVNGNIKHNVVDALNGDETKWDGSVMRGPWRLINGKALYNIKADPGQTRDLAGRRLHMHISESTHMPTIIFSRSKGTCR